MPYWHPEKAFELTLISVEFARERHTQLEFARVLFERFIVLELLILILLPTIGVVTLILSITISLELLTVIPLILGLFEALHVGQYLFIVIGEPSIPLILLSTRVSFHVSPHERDTLSHRRSGVAFTFAIVCHAVATESPSLASLPLVELT
jgi:hypothetical protein